MSSTDTDVRGKKSMSRETEDFADQIDAIRADIQSLTSTVSRIANKQINRAQDKAVEAAKPGRRGNPAEPTCGGGHRRRPWLPVRRLHPALEPCSARQ